LVSLLKITIPSLGDAMALLCAVVILGGRKPEVVEVTSKIPAGVVVPIPTRPDEVAKDAFSVDFNSLYSP
jgi:hypothetical protein